MNWIYFFSIIANYDSTQRRLLFLLSTALTLSSTSFAAITPQCRFSVSGTYQVGHLKYKLVEWLPDNQNPAVYEDRVMDYDFWTGQQKELIHLSLPVPVSMGQKTQYLSETYFQTSHTSYEMIDHQTGKIVRRPVIYHANIRPALNPMKPEENPFYGVDVRFKNGFHKLIEPNLIDNESMKQFEDLSRTKSRDDFTPNSLQYLGYPEVTVFGEISTHQFRTNISEVFLYSTNPNKPNQTLRIQKFKSKELKGETIDLVNADVFSTNELGPLLPGLTSRLARKVPEFLQEELRQIMKRLNGYKVRAIDKVFDRFLHIVGISRENLKQIQEQLFREGRKIQSGYIKEILDFIIPLYVERRGWSLEKIKDFAANAYKTMNSTKYIIIRGDNDKIAAVLGLTTVNYGKIRFFDKVKAQYVEVMGPHGSSFLLEKYGDLRQPSEIPFQGLWHHPVELLPVETEGFQIPRPAVWEGPVDISQNELAIRLESDFYLEKKGFAPDFTKPVYFFTGRVIEPVKFGVAKNLNDLGISNVEVLTKMLQLLFSSELTPDFQMNGQLLATYNTPDGVRMYRRLGFSKIPGVQSKIVDGQEWIPMIATPKSVVEAINEIKYLKSEEAESILQELMQRVQRSTN
ncbi:MAG: hypothetical protein ACK5W9_11260 [Bdellovibrionales bacterium]